MKTTTLYLASYMFGFILAASSVAAADPPYVLLHSLLDPSTNAQIGAEQGESVAIDGNIAVVGAPTDDDSGTVKVYDATTGAVLYTLPNPIPSSTIAFGRSVSISGTRVVVGASEIGDDSGGVYIYDLASTTPTIPVLTIINPFPDEDARFGMSVSISGTRVVVGKRGVVHVFDLSGPTPEQPVATLNDPTHVTSSSFGAAVAISGEHVVVGAFHEFDVGRAYIYDLSSATPTVPVATLNNPNPQAQDGFGFRVAISGTRAVIGAPGFSFPARSGRAYVYDLASATPTVLTTTLSHPSPMPGDTFGWAVAISGTRVIVGAPSEYTGNADAGSAYVYDLLGATPGAPIVALRYPSVALKATFGYSVAMSDVRVLVGAPGDDTRAYAAGSAYVYDLSSATPTTPVATLSDPNPSTQDFFGSPVAVSGTRLVVGNQAYANVIPYVYVYDLRSATPVPLVLTNPAPTPAGFSTFGLAVAISGRWVVVGSPYNPGSLSAGVAYVYDLDGAAPTVPVLTLNNPSPAANDAFGRAVAMSGTRVVVGAPYDDTGGISSGSAYVYDLANNTPGIPIATLNNPSPRANDGFGTSVAISDTGIVVGTPGYDIGGYDLGRAYTYDLASASPTAPIATLDNPNLLNGSRNFGTSVAISGTRIAVGAPSDSGVAYVYDIANPTPTVPIATLPNPTPGSLEYFGASLAISGMRVVVGAYYDRVGEIYYAGSAYVFDLAAGAPFVPIASLTSPTPAAFDEFGRSVAIDADIVVVGAAAVDINGLNRGAAYVFIANQPTVDGLVRLVESANLGRGERPLLATLNAAAASFDRGTITSGINQLEAFQNKVRAQIALRDPALAASFIDAAQAIINIYEQGDDTLHGHGQGKAKANGKHKGE